MTFFDMSRLGLLRALGRTPADRDLAAPRGATWRRRDVAMSILAVVLVAAVAFARWQIADAVVPWDSKNHFYAMFRFLGDALRHGTVPLWNPYVFSGYPAVADPQSLLFTPSLLLVALCWPTASMQVFDAAIMAHLALGGLGMIALGRRAGWHPSAAVLAALVFMLGGSAAARLQHTGMIVSYAFFPCALFTLQTALDRRSLPRAVAAGLLTALMALGRDQVAYLLCLALAGAAVWRIAAAPRPAAFLRERLAVLALAGGVTVLAMAVPIVLTLQFVHDSNRPGIAYGVALEGSLDPVNLLTLAAPNVFGSLDRVYDYWGPGAATTAGNDWTDRSIDYLFVGTLPALLIVWHGLAGRRLFAREGRYALALVVVALLYAVGRLTPFFSLVFDGVPGVSLYRRPADATFLLNVGLALAAGLLLHRYIEDGLPRLRFDRTGWAPALVVIGGASLVGAGLTFARDAHHLEPSALALSAAAALAGLLAAILVLGRGPRRRRVVAGLLVVATAGQLVWRNSASAVNAEPAGRYDVYAGLSPDAARGLEVLQRELAERHAKGERPRVEILGLDGPWQNAAMVLKLEDTIGYNPLRIAEYEQATGVAESANDPVLRQFPNTFRGYNSRLAQLLGLDYLVLDRRIDDLPRHIPRPRATVLFSGDHFYVYRLDGPIAPRAYLATHVLSVDSRAALDDGMIPRFDVPAEALVDARDLDKLAPEFGEETGATGTSTTRIVSYRDNDVCLEVDAARAGVLVLHDLAYPGWIVRVDGREAPLLRANLLFRGVGVPAGHHVVEFSFHPLSLQNLTAAARGLLSRG